MENEWDAGRGSVGRYSTTTTESRQAKKTSEYSAYHYFWSASFLALTMTIFDSLFNLVFPFLCCRSSIERLNAANKKSSKNTTKHFQRLTNMTHEMALVTRDVRHKPTHTHAYFCVCMYVFFSFSSALQGSFLLWCWLAGSKQRQQKMMENQEKETVLKIYNHVLQGCLCVFVFFFLLFLL